MSEKYLQDIQNLSQDLAHLSARLLIASYFLAYSFGLIADHNDLVQVLNAKNLPEILGFTYQAFIFLAVLSLAVGYNTRLSALLLAMLVFWTSFIVNFSSAGPTALAVFWQDIAMIGALLLAFNRSHGRYSLDHLREVMALKQEHTISPEVARMQKDLHLEEAFEGQYRQNHAGERLSTPLVSSSNGGVS